MGNRRYYLCQWRDAVHIEPKYCSKRTRRIEVGPYHSHPETAYFASFKTSNDREEKMEVSKGSIEGKKLNRKGELEAITRHWLT